MSLPLNDLEGGSKSWSPEVGDKIKGRIVGAKRVQQTSFTDNTPLTWADGSPRMQTVIELQTDERDSDDDDGIRSVWLKGGKNFEPQTGGGSSGEVALAEAVKAAGCNSVDEGADLAIECSGLAKPTTRGYQSAKLYRMQYKAPTQSIPTDDLFAE